jgi:hypothetical protein
MELPKAIYAILSLDAELVALTGNRIYPVVAQQREAYPILTYQIIANTPNDTKSGASTVDQVRVQFNCWAEDQDSANNMDTKLRAAIDRYPHVTVEDLHLDGIRYIDTTENFEDEVKKFVVMSDYYIRHKRVVAGPTINECLELSSFPFTLPEGDSTFDAGFLVSSSHLLFGAYTGPLIYGVDYTVAGTVVTVTDAPFPDEVKFVVVRNRVRVRQYTLPADEDTVIIGALLQYAVLVHVGDTLLIEGDDYEIITQSSIQFLNPDPSGFTFKITANACIAI